MSKSLTRQRARRQAGRAVRRRLRAEAWLAVRRSRGLLLWGVLGYLTIVAVFITIGPAVGWPPRAQGFFLGVLVGILPYVGHTLWVAWGFGHRSMGAEAEVWTAQELAKLDARWSVYHDVPVRHGNVDHVVVGPGRVYAVETKWTTDTRIPAVVSGGAHGAERQADALRQALARNGVRLEVVPLLILWGPRMGDRIGERPRLEGRTRVMAGVHSDVWLARIAAARSGPEPDPSVVLALHAILEAADPPRSWRFNPWRRRPTSDATPAIASPER